jgi:hypothetical protein
VTVQNTALADELIAINSIYGNGTALATFSDLEHTSVELRPFPEDQWTFYARFTAAYPSEAPIITGFHPLHLATDAIFTGEISYLRACIIKNYIPGEVCLHDTLSEYLSIRMISAQLPIDQRAPLVKLTNPTVLALNDQLAALAEAVHCVVSPVLTSVRPLVSTCSVCLSTIFTIHAARLPHCGHFYCAGCLQTAIKQVITSRDPFRCCGKLIPSEIASRYGNLKEIHLRRYCAYLEETTTSKPLYCHILTCGSFIPSYNIKSGEGRCPECDHLTCARCRGQVHVRTFCRYDTGMSDLVKRAGWKFCPGCGHLVERIDGCKSMSCVCGVKFCYHCGQISSNQWNGHLGSGCCLGGRVWDTMADLARGEN